MWSLMIRSPNEDMREYPLKNGINVIGRSAEADIQIPDNSASRKHALITFDDNNNTITLEDLDSTNGTFINGKQVEVSLVLSHQDQIRIGQHLLTVVAHQLRTPPPKPSDATKSIVTSDLMFRSIDNYAVLLHDIGYQLINIPDLDKAFATISETIKRMVAATDCFIVLTEDKETLAKTRVPENIIQEVIGQNSAMIFTFLGKAAMLVPVSIETQVVALIFVTRATASFQFSQESDLQLAIAVSHQVALSIQRNKVEQELLHNAYHDTLTGLYNRPLFLDRLHQANLRAKRKEDNIFAVLFLDIDNFKVVNDSLGHVYGDELLIRFAQRLTTNLRELDTVSRFDTVARLGGDEFVILLNDLNEEDDAMIIADRIKETIKIPFTLKNKDIFVTCSIGITINTFGYDETEDMLRDADLAMHRAKELGKDRIEIYDNVLHNRLLQRFSLETELRKGMQREEFRLHYQPIISLKTGRIIGLESLLRWYTPDRGVLEPGKFIKALDTSGLLHTIDIWGLKRACQDAAYWQKLIPQDPPIYVSVNVTPKLMYNPELFNILDETLEKTGIAPGSLRLEITEQASFGKEDKILKILNEIRRKNILFCLDDFGTGYSTLSYLLRFPIEALKIDQSFTKMIDTNTESYQIIEAIRALTRHMDLSIIAEGVENEKQLQLLRDLECDYAQGFLFSKGLALDSVIELIQSQPAW
jgi:diguanylate cyclase (GGDEF)-like protein